MNPINLYDNVGPGKTFLFDVKFLDLEYIFYKIYIFLNQIFGFRDTGVAIDSTTSGNFINNSPSGGVFNFALTSELLKDILYLLIIFFMTIICYSAVRILEIRKKEAAHLQEEIATYATKKKESESQITSNRIKNQRWAEVLKYMNTTDEAKWRLAVIEADSMLDELLTRLGFAGEGIGDKLKLLTKEEFRFLPQAWEAHAMRNKIAHEGMNFTLTLREATRVIGIYEYVFREYDFI